MAVLNILPECFVDTRVSELVSKSPQKFNHQHGCGQIANLLKNRLKDHIALGIIDEDKNKGPVAKYFLEFEQVKSENALILKKHREKKQYLIVICPEIERWLFINAGIVNLSLVEYDLPDELKFFTQITKTKNINTHNGFTGFIKELINKQAPGIFTLQNWLTAFQNNTIENL